MKSKTYGNRTALLLAALALVVLASAAGAGQGITEPQSSCTSSNCQSLSLWGTYEVDSSGVSDCFQVQLYSMGDECVRVHVLRQLGTDTDATMVLACPGGRVWQDDDSGGGFKPLIKAETERAGWCTLQVCGWVATPDTFSDFLLRYGRYQLGNPNCANPTVPLAGMIADSSKDKRIDPQ